MGWGEVRGQVAEDFVRGLVERHRALSGNNLVVFVDQHNNLTWITLRTTYHMTEVESVLIISLKFNANVFPIIHHEKWSIFQEKVFNVIVYLITSTFNINKILNRRHMHHQSSPKYSLIEIISQELQGNPCVSCYVFKIISWANLNFMCS